MKRMVTVTLMMLYLGIASLYAQQEGLKDTPPAGA